MQTVELAFERFGEQHAGCPLVILHGFFACSRNWRSIAKQLAKQFQVYVPDMRNHGISPHNQWMSYQIMAADVALLMDRLQIERINLLGHSMGGKIAMWFALQFPERVEQLIVADIAPVSYNHSFENTINALKNLPLIDLTNRKQAEEWLAEEIADLNYRQFLLQNLMFDKGIYQWRINLDFFHRNAKHVVAFPDSGHLDTYLKPSLFLAGEHSQYITEEAAIYRLFPQARIEAIANTGHWLHVEEPQLFCQAVEAWLNCQQTAPKDHEPNSDRLKE